MSYLNLLAIFQTKDNSQSVTRIKKDKTQFY